MKDKITFDDYNKLRDGLKEAQNKTDPFLVVDNDTESLYVVGDANKTERKSKQYTITLRFPIELEKDIEEYGKEINVIRKSDNFVWAEATIKDVYLSPRRDLDILKAIYKIFPYFKKVVDDGEITEFTDKEALELIVNMENEISEAFYNVVGAFLQIDDIFLDCIIMRSILETAFSLMNDFPEVFREADTFFA